jgi:hypothetical protein
MTTEGELTINNFLGITTSVPVLKYPLDGSKKMKKLGE